MGLFANFLSLSNGGRPTLKSTETGGEHIPHVNIDAGTVTGDHRSVIVSFARPSNTTAYTGGDAIGAADAGTAANAGSAVLEFANIGAAGRVIMITDLQLRIDRNSVPSGMGALRLHLYNAAPDAVLDNGVWNLPANDRTKYRGYIDIPSAPIDFGDTIFAQVTGANKSVKLADGVTSLWAVLVTGAGYTPESGTNHMVRLVALGI